MEKKTFGIYSKIFSLFVLKFLRVQMYMCLRVFHLQQ